ncbi:response regulator transcription factor [Flavobacterium selenitireducens]|uniref:response regulator transcription factor n=1 Tax=Flavobacterium selenitireducens TaxID=2722704 RepID=UPI00168B9A49|nr:response regulator transcription factor [Flavobacterium selenitireducens]MBD3582373.1 response regulator transcription factor [Flavobacterium selenitireducens]
MIKKVAVLFVEDEPFLGKVISESLEKQGFAVTWLQDGNSALQNFAPSKFDICILDVMLPQLDGFALASRIRLNDAAVPILFLTARGGIEDLKNGYASGGNDYLRKPFSLDELFLRVSELLKRRDLGMLPGEFKVGNLLFDHRKLRLVAPSGNIVKLSHRECELLLLLLQNRDGMLDRKSALLQLWGDDNFFTARSMDVYITKLRKKLAADASVEIVNLRGFGYKLIG